MMLIFEPTTVCMVRKYESISDRNRIEYWCKGKWLNDIASYEYCMSLVISETYSKLSSIQSKLAYGKGRIQY